MTNFKKAVLFGLVGWGTLAAFSVAQYPKILAKSCYFGQSWLFCSSQLNVGLKIVLMLVFSLIITCVLFSGIFIWKCFKDKEVISTKKTVITVLVFLFLSLLVVPFSSGDVVYYFYAGKTVQSGINPFVQDWSRENTFVSPTAKNYNERFPYGPLMARAFGIVYEVSQGNVLLFIFFWKLTVLLFSLLCGWLIYKFLHFINQDVKKNSFWLVWCLQPMMLFEGLATGHQDIIWLFFLMLAVIFAQQKKWWLVLPCLTVGIWIKFVPIFFVPFFMLKWWQDLGKENWQKLFFHQMVGIILSILITYLSWINFWGGFTVFTSLAKMSKTAAGSTFAAIYYSLAPLFKYIIGSNFHWYLTRVVQFSLVAVILYMVYPIIKKMFRILLKKDSWGEVEFIGVLFASLLVYMIFWQKWVWSWYFLWFLPLAVIVNVLSDNKYLKRAAIWVTLTPLLFYVVWLFNYLITNGGDATMELWFYWYMVLLFFVYPAYNLFKWRKIGYNI